MLKKVFALIFVLALVTGCAFADSRTIDLEAMSREELEELKSEIQAEIASRATEAAENGEYEATRKDPAPIGATVRVEEDSYVGSYTLDITVTNVLRGDAAWDVVKGWNRWNDKPSADEEYVVVYMRMDAIDSEDDQQIEISSYKFSFISNDGVEYGWSNVSGETPEIKSLYAGATNSCAIARLVNKGDSVKMVYNEGWDSAKWFDLNNRVPIVLPDDIVLNPLEKGASGDDVVRLQATLIEMGYLDGSADGSYGTKTQKAVSKYQNDMGLEATGIADEETQRLILTMTYPEK